MNYFWLLVIAFPILILGLLLTSPLIPKDGEEDTEDREEEEEEL